MPEENICNSCGKVNPASSHFCLYCGNKITQAQTQIICPHCGNQLIQGANFCPRCGMKIDDSSMDSIIDEPTIIKSSDVGSANKLANTCATGCGWPVGVALAVFGIFLIIASIGALISGVNIGGCIIAFLFGFALFGWGSAIMKAVGYKIKL